MAVKGKTSVVFLLFVTLVLVSATVSFGLSKRDPEIGVCKQKCEQIKGSDQDVQIGCKKKCEKYFQEKQQREKQREQGQGGRDDDSYNIILAQEEVDVSKMVQDCHQSCQGSQGEQQHPYCFKQCMEERFQKQERRESGSSRGKSGGQRQHQQQSNNPYVFQEQHFTAKLETELGNVRVLQKFTDRSELFNGIEKYRVAFLEAEPQTFIIPNHWDADCLVYVANGEGTISMINQDSRQSNSIKRGDIFRVPAGVSVYLINKHDTERLVLAKIIRSVSVPGELQAFFSVGGDQPESSFFNAFSTEVLEAAFNVDRGSIEKLFGQQRQQQQRGQPRQQEQQQGIFKRATKEQIRSLSDTDESRLWPFGQRKQGGPYNIYKERPSVTNENGNLHEVDVNDLSELRDMNVAFSLFNISQGSMVGPIYNAKATVALVITNGQGQFEMACPHLTEQTSTSGEFNPTYQKVNSELRKGTVVVIPAGHPFVIEANNQDLEVVSFGMNSDVNEWFPLVGRNNVMTQWEDEAIDLTFGVPAKEVRQVIQKQNQRFFFKGPVRRGRAFA
uniref:vicilin Cor a 11.0101 n=1 Tax=Erigeron canadensis TaxID=72917 RepID=UPI001CB947F4|nr:vicilin Cor a 11.0101 [Erigeron canadensis]